MTVKHAFLGMDLGGTQARAALVTQEGQLLATSKKRVVEKKPQAVVSVLWEACREVMAQVPHVEIQGCGVGVPGQVRANSGIIAMAPNLGFRDIDFGTLLSQQLGRPVRVMNDLSAAAWGELHAGGAQGASDVFFAFVGSGVGGALVCNGQLVQGVGGFAGELGHLKMVPEGRKCGCGERGCLEAYVGGHNLMKQMQEATVGEKSSRLWNKPQAEWTPVWLEESALAGDEVARKIYEPAARYLSLAVANQVTLLNPALVVLGGGVLDNCPGLRKSVVEGVSTWASATSREQVKVVPAALKDDSGLVGAALWSAMT